MQISIHHDSKRNIQINGITIVPYRLYAIINQELHVQAIEQISVSSLVRAIGTRY